MDIYGEIEDFRWMAFFLRLNMGKMGASENLKYRLGFMSQVVWKE